MATGNPERSIARHGPPAVAAGALAFIPALSLAAFWLGGEGALIVVALVLPLGLALWPLPARLGRPAPRDAETGLALAGELAARLDVMLADCATEGLRTACVVIEADEPQVIEARFGAEALAGALRRSGERLAGALRDGDLVARCGPARFAVALAPSRRLDLESLVQIAARLQAALSEPLSIDGATVYASFSVGFCPNGRAPAADGAGLLDAAEAALSAARQAGPGSIRAFAPGMGRPAASHGALDGAITAALENGQIVAFFQPQMSTDTGAISGFETLARWLHPERGVLLPGEFLGAVHHAGLTRRLGEVMLYHALGALRSWDAQGLGVARVAVNFSPEELADPRLTERLSWELDRFGIAAPRLAVEILESVATGAEDEMVVRNIAALSGMGCAIDLDDFGTGHASIAAIRRFSVSRIKIDRSFVTRIDTDREQERLVTGILALAERLGLETLAEGVETTAEHARLAQLGCGHVQGFVLARPMPFEDTAAYLRRHGARVEAAPPLARKGR